MIKGIIIDATLKKYGLPLWMKEYIQEYLKGSGVSAIRYAASFMNVGRKKGAVRKDGIVLPNGKVFKKDQIAHLVNLFYYGEERVSQMSYNWSLEPDHNPDRQRHFAAMAKIEEKRVRAIKNVLEGLGCVADEPTKELVDVFDYVEGLKSWQERLVVKNVFLNYAYAQPFGIVFYRAFYPVSPEFMRSFGKEFYKRKDEEIFGERMAEEVIRTGQIDEDRLMALSTDILVRVARSINAELKNAKKAGIEKETLLLRNIAVAYPLYRLRELGTDIDVKREIANIKKKAQGKSLSKRKENP